MLPRFLANTHTSTRPSLPSELQIARFGLRSFMAPRGYEIYFICQIIITTGLVFALEKTHRKHIHAFPSMSALIKPWMTSDLRTLFRREDRQEPHFVPIVMPPNSRRQNVEQDNGGPDLAAIAPRSLAATLVGGINLQYGVHADRFCGQRFNLDRL